MSTHHDDRIARAEIDSCGIGFVADASGAAATDPARAREIVELALGGLACVRHRAAIAADGLSGDGAGLLVPLPAGFYARVGATAAGRELDADRLGVAFAYFDLDDDAACKTAQDAVREACAAEGLELVGWRDVPIDESNIGENARRDLPRMLQALILRPADVDRAEADRRALRARRRAEARCREEHVRHYFASFSFSTVTYKALVISDRLPAFYPDLTAGDFSAPFGIFHSRFSTNTAPAWERAQPFRHLCHNGEINTVAGNEHRMHARGHLGTEEVGLGPEELFRPLFPAHDSDSGKLDTTVELLLRGGRDVRHAVSMLVPEAWEGSRDLEPEVRDYFRYHACLSEPWDGPAGLIFTDGVRVGASLDRNGLRPLRYARCEDGTVAVASEAGAVNVAGRGRVQRGRLGPGEMLCVDPSAPRVDQPAWQDDTAVKRWLADRAPYGDWARDGLLSFLPGHAVDMPPTADELVPEQAAFGLNREELAMVLKPMATDAKEPTFSMGDDTPLAAVAGRPRPVFHYLKQRFAQVSNPPIDHLRERLVMSLRTCLGPRRPLLTEDAGAARLIELPTFFLYPDAVDALLDPTHDPFPAVLLDASFPISEGPAGLRAGLEALARFSVEAVQAGAGILVVTDENVGPDRAPIPSLLATGAIHHRLIAERIRSSVSLVVDTGDARDTHSIACLLGYGADAICPRVALHTVATMADEGQLGEVHSSEAQAKYQAAVEDGVLKIFSKMGIATVDGYRGAQIHEAIGLGPDVVDLCLRGTVSTVGGLAFDALGADVLERHATGFAEDEPALDEPGYIRFRKRGGEYHANNPQVISALHASIGLKVDNPDADGDDGSDAEPDGNGAGRRVARRVPSRRVRGGKEKLTEIAVVAP